MEEDPSTERQNTEEQEEEPIEPSLWKEDSTPVLPWVRNHICLDEEPHLIKDLAELDPRIQAYLHEGNSCGCHRIVYFPSFCWICSTTSIPKEFDNYSFGLSVEGFSELFAIQWNAWSQLSGGLDTRHDLCMVSPTGSGKTLAYALPIAQSLYRY